MNGLGPRRPTSTPPADDATVPASTPREPPEVALPTIVGPLAFGTGNKRAKKALQRRYGDIYSFRLPGVGSVVVIGDADLAKKVYRADPTVLHAANIIGPLLGGHSLFSLDEEDHRLQRKLLMPSFNGAALKKHHSIMREEAQRELSTWTDGSAFASVQSMSRITLRVILRTIYGADYGGPEFAELSRELPKAVRHAQVLAAAPFLRRNLGPWSPGGRQAAFRRKHDQVVDSLVARARRDAAAGVDRSDILSLLLAARTVDGLPLSRDELYDNLLGLVVAGYETTAGTLAWCLERITRDPELLALLQREAREGDTDALRTATIAEVQRVRPIVSETGRVAVQPFTLDEWHIPAGSTIVIEAPYLHDSHRYYDDPSAFDPDRFVHGRIDQSTWIPFGGGVRRCLGAAFAQAEMNIVLESVLQTWDLVPAAAPAERVAFRGVTYAPDGGGRIEVRRRIDPLPGVGAAADHRTREPRCPVDRDRGEEQ